MLKLAKYLKPFIPSIVLALLLLFGQAICDLNLPNFMSRIVNVGIQQGGVEHASPEAISPEGFDLMTYYMPEAARQAAAQSYASVTAADKNSQGKTYKSLYPGMGDTVYVLNDAGPNNREVLDEAFGRAAYTFVEVLRQMAQSAGQEINLSDEASFTFDMNMAYQAQALIKQAQGTMVNQGVSQDASINDAGLNEAYATQTGAMFTRAFYKELGMDSGAMQTRYIIRIGLYMLLIALLGGMATVLVGFLAPRVATGAARDLRRDIFNKVESFSQHEFDKFSSASLITRCTNDVSQMQMLVGMGLRMLCYAPIMGVGGVIMALRKSVSMSWIIALAVIVLIGLALIIVSIAMPRFKIIQKLIDKLNRVARENLNGLMVIRAFGTQKHEQERFDAANLELMQTNLFVSRVMAFVFPAITLIMNGVTLLIVWAGAHLIAGSALQIGDMMAFMQYAMQVIGSFMTISMMFIFVPRAAVSAERIAEVLDTDLSITDPSEPKPFIEAQKGTVEFNDVHFRYHDAEEDAVSGITFTAKPGQTTAIIGATGSGKSTLANLLMRFYDVTQGSILVDGVDIRAVSQTSLRDKIGYIPQKGILLSGTVASNIRYGHKEESADNDNYEDITQAADVAQATEFIMESPEGFAAEISQGGANVSGGQKQRLSIARALAKKPEILVFDDSFSALDFKTDAQLRRALKTYTADATVIVVAQRVGTIMHAEQIIVLDEGIIVGKGTHEELLRTCPAYHEIASSQFAMEQQTQTAQPFKAEPQGATI